MTSCFSFYGESFLSTDRLWLSIYSQLLTTLGGHLLRHLRTFDAVVTGNSPNVLLFYPPYEVALNNSMEQIPSSENSSFSDSQRILYTLWHTKFLLPFSQETTLVPILKEMRQALHKIRHVVRKTRFFAIYPDCERWNVLRLRAKQTTDRAHFLPNHKALSQSFFFQWHMFSEFPVACVLTKCPVIYGIV